MADESDSSRIAWFLAGASIGAVIALLYAPASGEETRRIIAKKTEEGRGALQDSGKDLLERGREMYERGRQLADEAAGVFERGRKLVEGTAGNLQDRT